MLEDWKNDSSEFISPAARRVQGSVLRQSVSPRREQLAKTWGMRNYLRKQEGVNEISSLDA